MVEILIILHGTLALALTSSVQFIIDKSKRTEGVPIWLKDKGREIKK
jgi:mannose/fructose-specific phosphotransferase system component IIA